MHRVLFAIVAASCSATTLADEAVAARSVFDQFERTLIKEPTYESTPKYNLIVLGTNGSAKVWMVEDGKRLFVDKNGNGDLSDDGPPIEPSNFRSSAKTESGRDRWDFNYKLDAITPADGSRHTRFDLRRWNYDGGEDTYGLSLSVDCQLPMYAGWFGTF